MYPNQPTQFPTPPTPPPDYLNQIAPQAPKSSPFKLNLKTIIILGAALILLVIIIAVTLSAVVNSQRQPLQQLSARLSSIQVIADKAQPNLKGSQLRSTNSNLRIFLTNTNRDIDQPLLAAGVSTDKIPASILSKESSDGILERLEDARLNAVYDRTYIREMRFILSNTLALMTQIESSTSSAELRTFLSAAKKDLEQLQASFETLDSSTR
jgi:hypothetical protein